jgi:hypothetical protein
MKRNMLIDSNVKKAAVIDRCFLVLPGEDSIRTSS